MICEPANKQCKGDDIMSGKLRTEKLRELREMYPEGTKVRLIRMDDIQAPPVGAIGTVTMVDDMCQVHVHWETGSGLALIPDEDEWEVIGD